MRRLANSLKEGEHDYTIATRQTYLLWFRTNVEHAQANMKGYNHLTKFGEKYPKVKREAGRNSLHPSIVSGK